MSTYLNIAQNSIFQILNLYFSANLLRDQKKNVMAKEHSKKVEPENKIYISGAALVILSPWQSS